MDDIEGLEGEDWISWTEKKIKALGAMLDLQPIIDDEVHEVLDPVEELVQWVGQDKIIIMEDDVVERAEERRKRLFARNLLRGQNE